MLMEIDPLPMRGSLMMTMAMLSPSRREVSSAEQLRRSPRLIPARFRLVAAEFLPVSLPTNFFPGQNPSYSGRWSPEAHQGAQEIGGAPWWASGVNLLLYHHFYPGKIRGQAYGTKLRRHEGEPWRNQSRALAELFCRGTLPSRRGKSSPTSSPTILSLGGGQSPSTSSPATHRYQSQT